MITITSLRPEKNGFSLKNQFAEIELIENKNGTYSVTNFCTLMKLEDLHVQEKEFKINAFIYDIKAFAKHSKKFVIIDLFIIKLTQDWLDSFVGNDFKYIGRNLIAYQLGESNG